ncbi:MAG TPA: polyphosphate polymerase domain-containing protein [Planctomycetota bacterium]|nr:polyphosphate polymerase domain-containing protein [Planctomycetota bacterium]
MVTRPETRLHFSRFEFKYVLPQALRDQIEAELQHFVELDPYVVDQPSHEYFVRSLYFDTPDFACFHDKQDGLHTRAKFRIRTYAQAISDSAPAFLEIKGRYNNLVWKHRSPFDGAFERSLPGDALCRAVLRHVAEGAVRNQFEFELYRRHLRPVALVDYLRRPYISRFDPDFRLTFDHRLAGAEADSLFPRQVASSRRLLPGATVMELKFRRHVPAWFHHIIQAYELRRTSVSKICTGMQALGLQLATT